jgi:hypothetical protein
MTRTSANTPPTAYPIGKPRVSPTTNYDTTKPPTYLLHTHPPTYLPTYLPTHLHTFPPPQKHVRLHDPDQIRWRFLFLLFLFCPHPPQIRRIEPRAMSHTTQNPNDFTAATTQNSILLLPSHVLNQSHPNSVFFLTLRRTAARLGLWTQ